MVPYHISIFKNSIAHGMMIGGILSEMLFAEYGDLWLSKSSIDIKFKAPVYMNEEITTYGEVIKNEDNKLKIDLVVQKNNGTEVIKGFAIIEF